MKHMVPNIWNSTAITYDGLYPSISEKSILCQCCNNGEFSDEGSLAKHIIYQDLRTQHKCTQAWKADRQIWFFLSCYYKVIHCSILHSAKELILLLMPRGGQILNKNKSYLLMSSFITFKYRFRYKFKRKHSWNQNCI